MDPRFEITTGFLKYNPMLDFNKIPPNCKREEN
jgi:hypothetical protein